MGKLIGLLAMAIGVVWLLSNFGVITMGSWSEILSVYWPLILVYIGLAGLWSYRKRERAMRYLPLILIVVGVGLQLDLLEFLDFFSFSFPMALILFGLWLQSNKKSEDRYGRTEIVETEHGLPSVAQGYEGKHMVGSLKIGGTGWQLESARYSHKVGDVKVDLRETEIPLGETVLEISCKVGDIDVRLPENADVWIQAHAKMGDVKVFDQRNSGSNVSLIYKSTGYEEAERKLKLLIFMKMGDIDVKRVD